MQPAVMGILSIATLKIFLDFKRFKFTPHIELVIMLLFDDQPICRSAVLGDRRVWGKLGNLLGQFPPLLFGELFCFGFVFCTGCTESGVEGFLLVLRFATCFPFWFPECLGCSFCSCAVLIPLHILLDGRLVVLKFWIQVEVFASHFIT